MGNFFDIIFDYEKRRKMKEHPIFKRIVNMFPVTSEDIGNSKYLLLQKHYNVTRNNEFAVVKLNEWTKYYFDSGASKAFTDTASQSKQYFGRTEEELNSVAEKLIERANKSGFNITKQGAANIVYIKAIDEPYEHYMRCCNVIFLLRRKHQDMKFELATPLDNESYSVDIMAKKGDAVTWITVLPYEMFKSGIEDTFKQKHEILKMIWGCSVLFIYAEVNGKTAEKLPEFTET